MRTKVLGLALATLLLTATAYADAVFTMGNHNQPDEENTLFTTISNTDLMLTVKMSDGKTFTTTYGRTSGNNFMTIMTTGGEMISSVTIDSVSGFEDLKQPQISGISGLTLAPEFSSMILLGSGLLGVACVMRHKLP